MKLSEFASPLIAESNSIKVAFGGEAGSGKTYTAITFMIGAYKDMKCTKPILYLDNEKGSKFTKPLFDKSKIPVFVKQTGSLRDVQEAFSLLDKGEVEFVFIDSLSRIYKNFVEEYKAKNKITFMALLHWGRILPIWDKEFTDRYVKLNGNIIFTGRGGYTWTKDEDTKNDMGETIEKGQMHKENVKLKLPTESAYEPDFIVWMTGYSKPKDGKLDIVHQAQVIKDRSALLDGKVFENPTYADFKPFISFMNKLKLGDVSVEGEKSGDLIPNGADRMYWERKEKSEIFLEKIKAMFDKFGISGTGKDIKQINALIAEKIFGTTSWKEMEMSSLEKLEMHLNNLTVFFAHMDESTLSDKELLISYIRKFQLVTAEERQFKLSAKA